MNMDLKMDLEMEMDLEMDLDMEMDMEMDLDMDLDMEMEMEMEMEIEMEMDMEMDMEMEMEMEMEIEMEMDMEMDMEMEIDMDMEMDKSVVYTVITNGKDTLLPQPVDSNATYICFSDKPFKHHQWKFIPIDVLGLGDPRRVARRYKILSHIYFPDQDTIWVDGRVRLNKTPTELMGKYKGNICMRPHPSRKCIYEEAKEVVRIKYEYPQIVDVQMKKYGNLEFPKRYGLHETGMVIRRFSEDTENFNNAWWAEVSTGSKRDQLSCDFVRWYTGIKIQQVNRAEVTVTRHKKVTNVNT